MSYHNDIKRMIDGHFDEDPSGVGFFWKIARSMKAGEFDQDDVAVVVQRPEGRHTYDLYDAWVFGQICGLKQMGALNVLRVECGSSPDSDRETIANDAKLKKLPDPFEGEFWGGRHDCDGSIGWKEDIGLPDLGVTWRAQQRVPLEVGTTRATTTWWHLCRTGALARWPYGSTGVFIMVWKSAAESVVDLLPERLRKKAR